MSPGSRVMRANETRIIPKRVVIVLVPELPERAQAGNEERGAN